MKYLFGPVNSRRLGISLGIDLLQRKICTLDCIYCECGHTIDLTDEIDEYSPAGEVIAELDSFLESGPVLDAITFSGSGEPTLCSSIGEIINHLKSKYPQYRIVVLTNGTLLHMPEVRERLKNSDVVMPSLDAVSEDVFQKIYRAGSVSSPDKLIKGIKQFRSEFKGKIILEIFIIPGVNDSQEELEKLKRASEEIKPDGIQLNTLHRPSAEKWIKRADYGQLEKIRDFFSPLPVEIIGSPSGKTEAAVVDNLQERIIATLKRRPSTADDLISALGSERNNMEKNLAEMIDRGIVNIEENARGVFYILNR
jgi:wyosine [tRNA(Phe)-imidazoG37] synthetase (radical SAM superfamily)